MLGKGLTLIDTYEIWVWEWANGGMWETPLVGHNSCW